MSERFRRLQARKMSKRRAGCGSPPEMTISKRRTIEACDEFTFCDEVTSPIDTLFAPLPLPEVKSPIRELFSLPPVAFVAAKILENPSDFLDLAKLRMKDFQKFVEEEVPISNDVARSLFSEVWLNPCFVRALAAALDKDGEMIAAVMYFSNRKSAADRNAQMEADPYFRPSVTGFRKPTSASTFLRLFLSILIGHWGDENVLRVLDGEMGKNVFGFHLDLSARMKAKQIQRAGKNDEVETFSFCIEDASDAKDLKLLRELMVERYGPREDRDIEAILEKIKPDLSKLLSISQDYLSYDGKKTQLKISVINGGYSVISMSTMPSN